MRLKLKLEYDGTRFRGWAVQLNLDSPETVWANPAGREKHDVDTVVAVHP